MMYETGEGCDACGARAYVHVIMDVDDLPLSFCSHCWTANEEALSAYTTRTVDLRDTLLKGTP